MRSCTYSDGVREDQKARDAREETLVLHFAAFASFAVFAVGVVTRDTCECYSDIVNGCSNASATQRRKRAASAPSITRWSYESDNGSISRGSKRSLT